MPEPDTARTAPRQSGGPGTRQGRRTARLHAASDHYRSCGGPRRAAIFEYCEDFHRRGLDHEVLTVGNHTDNAYLYLAVERKNPERAKELLQLLEWNGGNQGRIAIASINPRGTVHAHQFSWDYTLGNVRERSFGEIWDDRSHPRMAILKNRTEHLPPRCRECRFVKMCNGNLRARAEYATGDFLGMDPSCYLTDQEIAAPVAV